MSAVKFEKKEKISKSLGIDDKRFEELREGISSVLAKSLMAHTTDIMQGKISVEAELDIEMILQGISSLAENANEALYVGYMAGMGVEHVKSHLANILGED
jgi:hypothetical protein